MLWQKQPILPVIKQEHENRKVVFIHVASLTQEDRQA